MVNKDQINAVLKSSFNIQGEYEITDEGVVNVYGDVDHKAKQTRLYVTFGSITGHFGSYWRGLKNLKGLPSEANSITVTYYPGMAVLRCLAATKQVGLQATNTKYPGYGTERYLINVILMKYVGQGKAGMIKCAAELIKSGYKEAARW